VGGNTRAPNFVSIIIMTTNAPRQPPRFKSKYWCFTLNNYTDDELEMLRNLVGGHLTTYAVFGKEVGESGTPHLQGYFEFKSRWDLIRLRRWALDRAHYEPRRGTAEEASNYCKKDGDWEQYGTISISNQGICNNTRLTLH